MHDPQVRLEEVIVPQREIYGGGAVSGRPRLVPQARVGRRRLEPVHVERLPSAKLDAGLSPRRVRYIHACCAARANSPSGMGRPEFGDGVQHAAGRAQEDPTAHASGDRCVSKARPAAIVWKRSTSWRWPRSADGRALALGWDDMWTWRYWCPRRDSNPETWD